MKEKVSEDYNIADSVSSLNTINEKNFENLRLLVSEKKEEIVEEVVNEENEYIHDYFEEDDEVSAI